LCGCSAPVGSSRSNNMSTGGYCFLVPGQAFWSGVLCIALFAQ
jgi:hypothetical protein